MAENQNFSNHTRYHTPFHKVGLPLVAVYLLWSIWLLIRQPGLESGMNLVLSFALVVTFFLTRINALKVQDRLIRLEEQLRFQRVLSAELAARASSIPVPFLVALRFAPDEELPDLVSQVLERKFAKPVEVKKAIKNWRGDHWRA
ncbi:MAG: hypothetical protein EBZ36_10165 [Acidobacteria bacterium]|nr:hypothetical protein [Acidobacteriota bacterium]